ncbi:Uncharacterised protein [Mycobacteroides abscessus subsp. abscessus]|nr:Uncharacterised protein [Mycobacteroides abscessus subsp. abscessus]
MRGDDDGDLSVPGVRPKFDDGREDHQHSRGDAARGGGPGPIGPQLLCQPAEHRRVE